MTISASLVRDLREKTGAGMMDCKRALTETNGDFDSAVDFLRTKGLAAAAKKSARVAAQGLTAIAVDGKVGVVVELNSETDFVARNEQFQALLEEITQLALTCDSMEQLQQKTCVSGKSVQDAIVDAIATIGENIHLRRMKRLVVKNGAIGQYIHGAIKPNMGRIAVLIALESESTNVSALETLGKQLAMHTAAMSPLVLTTEALESEVIERERNIFIEQTKDLNRPADIIQKMVEGRVRKFYEEVVLLEQTFVMDNKSKISEVLAENAKSLGAPIALKSFVRFELGQGIQVEEKDFAAEVAAITNSN